MAFIRVTQSHGYHTNETPPVYDAIAQDPLFFRFLSRIDAELAAETQRAGCRRRAGRLHVADFPRKPRGCPAAVVKEYSRRFSFTCGRCDLRATSPSVRFLGRRVYVAVTLMLSSPPAGSASRQLGTLLSLSRRTVLCWRRWWTQEFPHTCFWQAMRSRFIASVVRTQLPHSLLERFESKTPTARLVQALRFLSPLSGSCVIR
jgi:hypothetical protein